MRRKEERDGERDGGLLRPIEQSSGDGLLDCCKRDWPRCAGQRVACSPARGSWGLVLALLVACSSSSASTAASSTASTDPTGAKPLGLAPAAGAPTPQQVVQRIEPVREVAATSVAAKSVATASAAGGAGGRSDSSRPAGITARHLEAELNRLEAELNR